MTNYLTENFNNYKTVAQQAIRYYLKSHCHTMKDLGKVHFKSKEDFEAPKKNGFVASDKFRHSSAIIVATMYEENGEELKFWWRDKMHYHAAYLIDVDNTVIFVLYIPTRESDRNDPNVHVTDMTTLEGNTTAMTRIEFNLDDLLA